MKHIIITLIVSVFCLSAIGQIKVQGIISDTTGEPSVGVTVVIKGTQKGTISDVDGKYEISVPNQETELVFSFITYKSQIIKVGQQQTINVVMEEDKKELDEVVVIGFGAVKRGDLTSSISSVKGEDIQSMSVGNINQSLQGKVAGVQVLGAGGPGSQPKVLIRGISTVSLSTNPLYVVDGVPMSGDINFLSPNEIENMEVLKDASASAIYGSRASNGVIMITTKKGMKGKLNFDMELNYGVQEMKNPYNMADAVEYAEILNTAAINAGMSKEFDDPLEYEGKTTEWWKAGIREYAPQMNLGFGFQGGDDKKLYSFNINYYEQDSYYQKGGFKRITMRLNNDYTFNEVVSAGISLNPRFQSWGNPGNWADFDRIDPITPIYKSADQIKESDNEYSIYARSPSYVWNPVATVARWNQKNESYALSTSGYMQIKPLKDLIFRSQLSFELDSRISDIISPDFIIDAAHEYQTYNKVERSQPMYRNWSMQNTLTYLKTIDERHNFTLMVGNTLEEWHGTTLKSTKEKTPNNFDSLQELDAATLNPTASGTSYTNSVMSYLGRIMYNMDNKYYITATYRRDGASKFMSKNKWAAFPSASVAWRVTGEDFMQKTSGTISDLKLRLGWGKVGNQNLPAGVYESKLGQDYYVIDGQVVNTVYPNTMKNQDIKWETVEDLNAGIDFSLWLGKFTGSLEYYVKNTEDMIFKKSFPLYSGYPDGAKIYYNVGSMQSKGFEVSLGYNEKFGDLILGSSFTLTTFDVKMKELSGDNDILYGSDEKTITVKGDEPGYFYGYKADGLFQNQAELNKHTNDKGKFLQPYAKEGDIRFVDVNRDGVLDASDRTKIGSPWADVTLGLNLNLGYKNFDMLANFYASIGNELVNQNKNELHNALGKTNKISGLMDKAWHGEGTSNDIPRLSRSDDNQNYSRFSSFYIEDGSFLRLKNLQFGYTFNNIRAFNKIRLYIGAQNLLTFTKFEGVEPEVSGDVINFGFAGWNYPVQRTFIGGVNVTF